MKNLLNFDAVTLNFGGLTALSEVTWGIPARGIFGIVGPNGAGKSTLFNLATGIYKPTSGAITFSDTALKPLKTEQIVRLGMARTFQNIRLLEHLTVLDNLLVVSAAERQGTFFKSLLRLPSAKREYAKILERAHSLLQLVGLVGAQGKLATSLPYGDQRKLEIARALMTQPQLLMLDEPAAGMNPVEKNSLDEMLKKVRDSGVTVLIIEHDMRFVMSLCERIMVLNQGKICAEGLPEEIQNNPSVIESYLGTRLSNRFKNHTESSDKIRSR